MYLLFTVSSSSILLIFTLVAVVVSLVAADGWLGCNDKPRWKPEMINEALVKFYRNCDGKNWPAAYKRNWDRADADKKDPMLCAIDGNERAHPGPFGTRCVIGPPWHNAPPKADGGLIYLEHLSGAAKGPVPAEFKAFQMVDWIGLSGNQLTGPLWDTSYHIFMHRLDLSHNKMSGTIDPKTFFTNSQRHLELLNLGDNKFSGPIPDTLNKLDTMTAILLNDNQFSGEIPDLSHLAKVRHLNLARNNLQGKVGRWLKEMIALSVLQLDGNAGLSGTLPELPDSIMRVSVSFTGFSGPIPKSYGQLPLLRHFNCTGCKNLQCPEPGLLDHLLFSTHCKRPRVY